MAYLSDFQLTGTWQNLYTLTGIASGTVVSIQNKNSQAIIVFVGDNHPVEPLTDGVVVFLKQTKYFSCDPRENIWIKGVGTCVIQSGYVDSPGLKIVDTNTGELRDATTSDFAQNWSTSSYVMDASGNLTSETQTDGVNYRTRVWTYSTDGGGNVTATAGEWS